MTAPFSMPERIAEVFDKPLHLAPDAEALITRRVRWSYRQLDDACARAAGALAALGVHPGDRVAAVLPNEADIVVAFHATMRLGAIWVGVNQALAPPEQAFLLQDSQASLLLCTADDAAGLEPHRPGLAALHTVVEAEQWRNLVDGSEPLRELPPLDPHAPAGLAYTSGTTGRPKGVIHSQHNLLVPGAVLVESRGYDAALRKGDCLPLTILNLMVLTTLLVAQAGGTAVIMDQLYAQGVAEWIEREAVTVWNGPPPILHSLVNSPDVPASALRSLREVWSGGADLPEALRQRFEEKFALPILATYGLSEAPTIVSIDPPGAHVAGASGRVLPHLDVRIAREAEARSTVEPRRSGDAADPGTPGEICLAARREGPFADLYRPPLGYWRRPEASAESFAGGVVHTGDIGLLDADGWLHVRDRKSLVINRGGANVYPAEIERVLDALDGVAGSAALGLPDERLGQRVVAAVEPDAGTTLDTEVLTGHCASQLARYKVPERITILDHLPRNAMGKVDRAALAALLAGH
jgi:acyl-CoA synthetase (AMP-forming)/AMP-acid ligase II